MWELDLQNPQSQVRKQILSQLPFVFEKMKNWLENELPKNLIFGGAGIVGIQETPFYQWLNSNEGLSQLGIDSSEPQKLLDAYLASFKIKKTTESIVLTFGDHDLLELLTPHPASGEGRLEIRSWLEWVLEDLKVQGFGYVSREDLSNRMQEYPRLSSPLGGLMLPAGSFGSSGSWQVPEQYQDFDTKWFIQNEPKIVELMESKFVELLNERFA